MQNLPAQSIATFDSLEDDLDREFANSGGSKALETQRSRQACYLKYARRHLLPDPCGQGPGWDRILAHYVKEVILGINIQNKDSLRSETIKGYAAEAIRLFRYRGFPDPFHFNDNNSMAATILRNYEEQEDIASQRYPLNERFFAAMLQIMTRSDFNSKEYCICDIAILARYLGFRLSEYGQKTQSKPEYHSFPCGTKIVLKAISTQDLVFITKDGRRLTEYDLNKIDEIDHLEVTFKVQKNRRNGEKKQILPDRKNPEMCPVLAALRIVIRARNLGQSQSLPCAVYHLKNTMRYITGKDVSSFLQNIARELYPDMPDSEIKKFTSHSLRVTAAVLLHEEGHDGDYIKIQLRWLGDSYRVYLRTTHTILQRHSDSLAKSAHTSIKLANLPQSVSYSVDQVDKNVMGTYTDI